MQGRRILIHIREVQRTLLLLAILVCGGTLRSQLTGVVMDVEKEKPLIGVTVSLLPGNVLSETNGDGKYVFEGIAAGQYQISLVDDRGRFAPTSKVVEYDGQFLEVGFEISEVAYVLATQQITDDYGGAAYLRSIEGMAIFAAKKTELIHPDSLLANVASNNARRLFVRVPGLTIWESDGGGLQLGIGGRGLSPNRTSNFNVRQNGYDIAADALGYPESYYTPPAEAIQRIEVVRGAASLQYGTQFGGMVNFLFKNGPQDRPFELTTRQTAGSYGFFNTFNSIGGTVAKGRLNYYAFGQFRRGNGWRANSGFRQATGFAGISTKVSDRARLGVEYTRMDYTAQQAGGLTDAMFDRDAQQSIRTRNWFKVRWNLFAVTGDFDLSDRTRLNTRNFGLIGFRHALGYLGSINRVDPLQERDLLKAEFNNFGNETRLLHRYVIGQRPAALLAGIRLYRGDTEMQQGFGSTGNDANFEYLDPENPGQSEFSFPSTNIAVFSENLINLSDRFSMTPGLRFEHIRTGSKGYYIQRAFDFAGNLLSEETLTDGRNKNRFLLLGGLGLSYRSNNWGELYGNWSQNYRAITFTDLRVANPNFRVDENLEDERGFNADLGWRGSLGDWLDFDLSVFYLNYSNRIGNVLKVDTTNFNYYRFRTNIADARNLGFELFGEVDLLQIMGWEPLFSLKLFGNFSYINARYADSQEPAFDGKQVELVPPISLKTGFNLGYRGWRFNGQLGHTAGHYSDATNAETSPTSVEGFIPSYTVVDASFGWNREWKRFETSLEGGVQNLLNATYFTRRATGYPGPGIIPSQPRNLYLTLGFQF